MNYLSVGSVVQLNNGLVKVVIVSRYPLYDNQGKIGYFDYSGAAYPYGTAENRFIFFNAEDIKTVWFEGYVDEQEKEYRQMIEKEIKKVEYPRFTLNDIE